MGCDIHIYVEKKNNSYNSNKNDELMVVKEKWSAIRNINKSDIKYCEERIEKDPDDKYYVRRLEEAKKECYEGWIYDGRNYDLFAILADVRNRSNIIPISQPKGVPNDIGSKVSSEYEDWRGDAHSASYYTLKELLEYKWDQKTNHSGVISISQYADYIKTGSPKCYSQSVMGGKVEYLTLDEANDYLKGKYKLDNDKSYYVKVYWSESYRESAEVFIENVIPELESLSDSVNKEDVRIVFWFDN